MTDDLDDMLRAARDDTAPLPHGLRARILADATDGAARPRGSGTGIGAWWAGLIGLPGAAVLGLWLGAVQPTLLPDLVPADTDDAVLVDEVFGAAWTEGETG